MDTENILLVEGPDDEHVVYALAKQYKLKENFQVISCQGIDNLFKTIPIRLKTSETKTIGIIIDADTDINKQVKRIEKILTDNSFSTPLSINKDGLILQRQDGIKIGVWFMPNNETEGMLEDFIKFLVPEDDKLSPIIASTLDKVEADKTVHYKNIHRSKAFIHTWLAWQKTPGEPMGKAITRKFLNSNTPECINFIDWLKRLFP